MQPQRNTPFRTSLDAMRGRGRGRSKTSNPMNFNLSKIIEEEKRKANPESDHPVLDFGGIPMTIFKNNHPYKCKMFRSWLLAEEICLIDNLWACTHKKGPFDDVYFRQILEALANYFKLMHKNYEFYVVYEGKVPGVYKFWTEVVKNTRNIPNSLYKGFETLSEAIASTTEFLGPNFFKSDSIKDFATVVDGSPIKDLVSENTELKQQIAYLNALRDGTVADTFFGNPVMDSREFVDDLSYYESFEGLDQIPLLDRNPSGPIFPKNYLTLNELEARSKQIGKGKGKISEGKLSEKISEARPSGSASFDPIIQQQQQSMPQPQTVELFQQQRELISPEMTLALSNLISAQLSSVLPEMTNHILASLQQPSEAKDEDINMTVSSSTPIPEPKET